MQFTAEHEEFRKSIRGVLEREFLPHIDDWEAAGTMPLREIFSTLADHGMLGLEYDQAYGGQGAPHSFTVVFCEEIGKINHSLAMAVGVQTDMATPALARFGTHDLKERYLRPALMGEAVASIAVTEPDAGSDVASIRTTARRDGDEWVINGTKLYITNGPQADWLCLLARTSPGVGHADMSLIVVPTDTSGFAVSRKLDKLGNRASDTAELSFTDVRVPVANTIGEVGRGFQQQMSQFQNERMSACYNAVGALEQAITRTAAYLKHRRAFGAPLIANQYVQFRLAELSAELELLRRLNYACAEQYEAGEDTTRLATIAKLKAGRLAREVADTCMQFHGGVGYMEETWTARFFRDARLLSIGGGADEVMLRVLSRMDGLAPD